MAHTPKTAAVKAGELRNHTRAVRRFIRILKKEIPELTAPRSFRNGVSFELTEALPTRAALHDRIEATMTKAGWEPQSAGLFPSLRMSHTPMWFVQPTSAFWRGNTDMWPQVAIQPERTVSGTPVLEVTWS